MNQRVRWTLTSGAFLCLLCTGFIASDAQGQTDQTEPVVPASSVTTKSAKAVGYEVGANETKVDMKGADLMPQANGEAKVEIEAKGGRTKVSVSLKGMTPPTHLGAEFLTYVLWVVTPEGRTGNTGEILLNKKGEGKLGATTPAQTFSLITGSG